MERTTRGWFQRIIGVEGKEREGEGRVVSGGEMDS